MNTTYKSTLTMKTIYITLISLLFSLTFLAQGIAVQGIARDNNKAAITQETLNFTFRILTSDSNELYTEDASIRTDNFGVFSHIVGTGTKLNGVDFSLQGLRIEVSVLYPTKVVVYDEGFNYTPYAHYAVKATDATNAINAANGVPTGSIMPFMGTTAPDGWLMCDGNNIPSGTQYDNLKTLLNDTKTPNLQGRFLKGAGYNSRENALNYRQFDETTLGQYQTQSMQNHRHTDGDLTTSPAGEHNHRLYRRGTRGGNGTSPLSVQSVSKDTHDNRVGDSNAFNGEALTTNTQGAHTHTITGNTGNAIKTSTALSSQPLFLATEETKPNNFSVNYIIKL